MSNLRSWIPKGQPQGCSSATMDPAIKLFGQTIGVSSAYTGAGADAGVRKPTCASPWDTASSCSQDGNYSRVLQAEQGVAEKRGSATISYREEFLQPPESTELVTEPGAPDVGAICEESEGAAPSDELKEDGAGGPKHMDDKNHPKPDKVVACPRCESLDTKFCYYNNYNVNQPRHFCKNCQRYWTAGGTLRNVPVGAGKRKNKHGGLQRDGPEGLLLVQTDSTDIAHQHISCSPTCENTKLLKMSPSKRLLLPRQGSPLWSPGRTSPLGQDSGLSMSSPYSLHQSAQLHFQSFSCSQGFMASDAQVSMAGSSSSGQRLGQSPSHSGYNKQGSRSALRGQKQNTDSLSPLPSSLNTSQLQLESSGTYRSVPGSDAGSWASNGAPFSSFNGAWPYGYHLDWKGNHPVAPPYGIGP